MEIPAGWSEEGECKALTRSITFKDFSEAFAFLTRVAMYAEKVDHHPEFTNVWNRVDFRLTTHDTGGVTTRDIKLAEAINRRGERPVAIGGVCRLRRFGHHTFSTTACLVEKLRLCLSGDERIANETAN